MPHFTDLDIDAPVEVPTGPAAPADVLARVKAEGARRRTRRHRRNAVLAAFGLAIVAVPAVALGPGDDPEEVTVAGQSERDARPTTTAERRPSTTVTAVSPTSVVVATTEAVTPDTPPVSVGGPQVIEREAPPATAGPVCRNSTDPACGDFRWDPQPANEPVTVTITPSNPNPVVGEEVVFTVRWSDPDAAEAFATFRSGDDADVGPTHGDTVCRGRSGPWTPPPGSPGQGVDEFRRVYTAAGTYEASTYVETDGPGSEGCDNWDAYGSEGTASVTITVSPAA